MNDREAEARRMRASGIPTTEIAARMGVSRQTVSRWTRDMGRPKIQQPSMFDFTPPVKHRRQHFYRAMLTKEAIDQELPVGPESIRRLEQVLADSVDHTWTYDDLRGFHRVPRLPEHHGRLFIKNL